jgi:GT2 family glycosyltransferase
MSKIGIVILNYNDYEQTREYVSSIKRYRYLDEIVVVDNRSTDISFRKLKDIEKKNITVLRSDENKGYSSGNNIGIKYLEDRVDYIIISNSDITFEEKVVKKLKEDLDNNPDIAVVAPVINQNGEQLRGWKLPKISDEIKLNMSGFQELFNKRLKYDNKRYDTELTKVDVVYGCFFMIRRDVLNLVGNFDDGVFLYYEENILGTKLKNINRKSYIDNEVSVEHSGSATVDKNYDKIWKYKMLKESQKYFVKYYLHANVFQMFLLRFTYRIRLIIAYIARFFKNLFKKKK